MEKKNDQILYEIIFSLIVRKNKLKELVKKIIQDEKYTKKGKINIPLSS